MVVREDLTTPGGNGSYAIFRGGGGGGGSGGGAGGGSGFGSGNISETAAMAAHGYVVAFVWKQH